MENKLIPEIIEGNELIVKFIGCKIDKKSYNDWWYEIKDGHFGYIDNLEYHSNWNWIMPICKKFIELSLYFEGNRSKTYDYIRRCDKLRSLICGFEIGDVFDYLINSIAWYNSLTPPKEDK